MTTNGYRINPFIQSLISTQQNISRNVSRNTGPIISNNQIILNRMINPFDQLSQDLNDIVIRKPSAIKKNREKDYILVKKIYNEKLKENLECLICFENIQSPVIVLCCKQFFCGSCLNSWVYTKNTCPHCRNFDPMFYSPEISREN
jgi:hypothetical protein